MSDLFPPGFNEVKYHKTLIKNFLDEEDTKGPFIIAVNSIIEHQLWSETTLQPLFRMSKGSRKAAIELIKAGFKLEDLQKRQITNEVFEQAFDTVVAYFSGGCEVEWAEE